MANTALFQQCALTLGVISVLSGCFHDEGPSHGTDTSPDDDSPVAGFLWCAEAEGAEASFAGSLPQDILDPENGNGPPKGCLCADEALNNALSTISVNGKAVVGNSHSQAMQDFRDLVFDEAEDRCLEIVGDDYPTSISNNCLLVLEAGTSPLEPEAGDCAVGDRSNPSDGWADYYALNSVIAYNPTTDVYEIDQTFFEDVLAHPNWLLADSATIGFNGTSYQFYGVQSGDIVAALGIQNNDVPDTLNGLDVSTMEAVFTAHVELRHDRVFELVVLRGTSFVTLTYVLDP